MAMRQPGVGSRNISLNASCFSSSGTRFTTELLMMQSAVASGRAISVMRDSTKKTLSALAISLFWLARLSISCTTHWFSFGVGLLRCDKLSNTPYFVHLYANGRSFGADFLSGEEYIETCATAEIDN